MKGLKCFLLGYAMVMLQSKVSFSRHEIRSHRTFSLARHGLEKFKGPLILAFRLPHEQAQYHRSIEPDGHFNLSLARPMAMLLRMARMEWSVVFAP